MDIFGLLGLAFVILFGFVIREKVEILGLEGIIIARSLLVSVVIMGFLFPDQFSVWGIMLFILMLPILYVYMQNERRENERI